MYSLSCATWLRIATAKSAVTMACRCVSDTHDELNARDDKVHGGGDMEAKAPELDGEVRD